MRHPEYSKFPIRPFRFTSPVPVHLELSNASRNHICYYWGLGAKMQIDNLSEQIDDKLVRLDQQLANLRAAREQVDDPQARGVIDSDIATLLETRAKLLKSRSLAVRVHQLRQETEHGSREAPFRGLGLTLMIFSAVVMVGIIAAFFWLR